jgi:transcriptional regulator with XRE-family HTH domain
MEVSQMATFQERLAYLKNKSGKTQVQIADELGITPQNLSYYFNGREPSYDLLIKIADLFDVSVDFVIGKSDFINFDCELQYKNLQINENEIQDAKFKIKTLKNLNENLSRTINDIIYIQDDRNSERALDALDYCFHMIQYVKETLRESFADMRDYIEVLKAIKESPISSSSLRGIQIPQKQVEACKEHLNEFLSLYVFSIFDFEKMKLKGDD